MTANVTIQSVLGETICQEDLTCPICQNRCTKPKLLDCLHSFCLDCLQELIDRQEKEKRKLKCPQCRCETILTEKEVDGLPSDLTISALVEEVTMQEKLQGQGSEIKCEACDEGNEATSRCMDCDHFLCQECQRAHERMAVFKSHQIYTVAQLRSGETTYKSKLREFIPKCEMHIDQNISLYCNTCEKFVCVTCHVLDHVNSEHSLVELPEARDKCEQELILKVEKRKTELNDALNAIDKSWKTLDSMFIDTNKKISQKAIKELARIRKEERNLKQDAHKIFKDTVMIFANKTTETTRAVNKLDKVHRLIAQASRYEILDLKKILLCNIKSIQPEKVSDRLFFMDFEEGERSLGRLVLERETNTELQAAAEESLRLGSMRRKEKWTLKTDIKSFGQKKIKFSEAYYVTAFSHDKIVVADSNHKLLIAFLPQSTPQGLQITGLTHPRRVAVSNDDWLVVLDHPAVKIFNKDFQLLHQFTPVRGLDSWASCLAADDNNLIAVGYKEEISLYNPDGSLIKTLPAPGIDDYLTIYKKRLIYTNWSKNNLLSVDYNGKMIFSVNIPGENRKLRWGPNGVCCDRDGGIYVAVLEVGSLTGEIQHFSSDGKYTECVIKDCGSPYGVTFTPGEDLVVTTGASVQIYHHV